MLLLWGLPCEDKAEAKVLLVAAEAWSVHAVAAEAWSVRAVANLWVGRAL